MSAFDIRAAQWDKKSRRVKLARDIVDTIIKHAVPQRGMDIADFGTGTGLILLGLADYAGTLTGYDSSAGMLEVLEEKAREAGLTTLKTVKIDIETDDFPSERADIMTASMVIHHLAEPKEFFRKAYDALREGGKLCVADLAVSEEPFHDDAEADVKHQGFDWDEVKRDLLDCGFSEVNVYEAAVVEKERDGKHLEFKINLAVAVK